MCGSFRGKYVKHIIAVLGMFCIYSTVSLRTPNGISRNPGWETLV